MSPSARYQRQIQIIILIVAGVGCAGLLIAYPATPAYAFGLALGVVGGLVKLRSRINTITYILNSTEDVSASAATASAFKGYAVMIGTVLIAHFSHGKINIWLAVAGLVLPNIILQADGFLRPSGGLSVDEGAAAEIPSGEQL